MNYQFNTDALTASSGLNKSALKKLIADVQKEFPNDPMMQELHLRRYVDYEKHQKEHATKKRNVH